MSHRHADEIQPSRGVRETTTEPPDDAVRARGVGVRQAARQLADRSSCRARPSRAARWRTVSCNSDIGILSTRRLPRHVNQHQRQPRSNRFARSSSSSMRRRNAEHRRRHVQDDRLVGEQRRCTHQPCSAARAQPPAVTLAASGEKGSLVAGRISRVALTPGASGSAQTN